MGRIDGRGRAQRRYRSDRIRMRPRADGLMRRMYRTIRVRPLEDFASLKAVSERAPKREVGDGKNEIGEAVAKNPERTKDRSTNRPCVRSFQSYAPLII